MLIVTLCFVSHFLSCHLQGLTQAEEMLVSAVMPIMSVYRLPLGQYGYSGHVVNLPQDVASFSQSLPRLPSQLDVIVVMYTSACVARHAQFSYECPVNPNITLLIVLLKFN